MRARLFEHGQNVRLFHKAEPRRRAPIIWLHFRHEKALRILDPRYRFDNSIQDEQIFLQGPIVFYVPDHDGRGVVRSSSEEDSGAVADTVFGSSVEREFVREGCKRRARRLGEYVLIES